MNESVTAYRTVAVDGVDVGTLVGLLVGDDVIGHVTDN